MSSAVSSWLTPRLPTLTHIGVSTLTWPLVLGGLYWLLPAASPLDAPLGASAQIG